jgi:orotate phosphoribosyltransferase
MVRKEPKGHGAGNQVEGRAGLPDGSKVCMIEDTVTTGGSLLRAIAAVEEAGLQVVQVICIVDRCEGAAERFAEAGYTLEALVTRRDIT